MTTLTAPKSIIVGTAGHIDHGKTRLVGKLSGINTDRLPEEQARGISIDLGFAHFRAGDFQIGIVDVPGHERFVRNMVAGATGINVAMLVVAADDAVMPQTREHLDIMNLLGIQVGLVALTKIDLVDEDMVELARCDIEDNLAGTFLEGCPIVPVSSETGEGIETLRETLLELCRNIQLPETLPLFRMAIDRVFSIPGHGTVVTGSVLSGDVHVGDSLDLWPEGREVRVRSVQRHGEQADEAGSRQRTAINLAGLKHDEVSRGDELATPDYLKPTKRLLVDLRLLENSPIGLKNRIEVGLHTGTREISCRVILKCRRLEPGERGYAELRLAEPMVATWGQRFIIRRISPAITLGGGTILDPHIPDLHRIRDVEAVASQLASPIPVERLAARLRQRDSVSSSDLTLASSIGVMPDELQQLLSALREDGKLLQLGRGERSIEIHADRLESLAGSVLRTIRNEVIRHQPRRSLPKPTLLTACRAIASSNLLEFILEHLVKKKELVELGSNLGPTDLQVQLTKHQRKNRDEILAQIVAGDLTPPMLKDLAKSLDLKSADVEQLLNLWVEDAMLIRVGDGLYYTPDALDEARQRCVRQIEDHGPATMAELRDAWEVTRKYSVPLCEYFDAVGVTIRDGDLRSAGSKSEVS
ncbi:MAG: selenocysteine-specific translation elongation factor [Planctomycetota bacterium]|nr:selenocysteine-specific translation elongation factor [Planctomycetota bacterium]MDA0918246.1 selenocysteine-specific translation elongation factor [Planctomycetota bacterium]MDA1158691.1 selenocysteine-specific translation elongation factor [Planctomycetota bacterium]